MNARLINSDPEILQGHTEACSAVAFLFLETSGKYFDLQMGAVKSSLDSFRGHYDLLEPSAEGKDFLAGYSSLFAKSLDAGGQLLCQSVALSAGSQRQFGQLIDQSWSQFKALSQQAAQAQLDLLANLYQPVTSAGR
jgi:hypothetical protein